MKRSDYIPYNKIDIPREVLYQKYVIEKKTMLKISKDFNISINVIHRNLKSYNIPRRSNSETTKMLFEGGFKHGMLGKKVSEETKRKIKKSLKKYYKTHKCISPMKGRKHTRDTKKKMRVVRKRIWENERFKEERIKSMKEKWKDQEFKERMIKAQLKGLAMRPTSFEQKIIYLNEKYGLPYKYVGDGQVIINGKCPDFINNNGNKQIIEVYCSYHKNKAFGSVENYKKERIRKLSEYGFKILFLDENDLRIKGWEDHCLNKINDFIGDIR